MWGGSVGLISARGQTILKERSDHQRTNSRKVKGGETCPLELRGVFRTCLTFGENP